ncbi:hypothetical protein ACGRHY_01145 [Streptomyces sp. HK10]|uniref:phosphatase domain-containing protein n=1 Tax=Streptomyces sp. HK10 TaxID=3373255 RepID=UPI00374789F6
MASRSLAVFDLDGTLADVRHRLHFLDGRRDWEAFFAAAPGDPPLAESVELALTAAGEHEIAYVTGRPEERCRRDTLRWLARHGLPDGPLLMRAGRDRRPARVTKPELLRGLARERTVAVVVDDDHQVCDAYEADGFTVVRAGWMTAEPALEKAQEDEGRT